MTRKLCFFQGGPDVSPDQWLRGHDWKPDVTTLAKETTAHGRDIPKMFQEGRPHEANLWPAHGILR
ncbi:MULTISPECIES: hypothetical protein [unclassified Streptomyces]|uniref:hypothetical protein n=1 Tax=unclassified Streptomyces TaxID=2593676 RepID=UPI003D94896C